MTLYLGSAMESQVVCNNEDREGRCDANDGEPCDGCVAARKEEHDFFLAQWRVASPEEKDPERYRREMREAGRASNLFPDSWGHE